MNTPAIKIGDRVQILSSLVSVPVFGKVLFIDKTLKRITVLVDGYAASNSFRLDELKLLEEEQDVNPST